MITLSPEHARCRGIGHAWDPVLCQVRRDDVGRYLEALLVCLRCKSEKTDFVDTRGARFTAGRYHYADGYLITGNGDRPNRWELAAQARVEIYRGLLKKGAR